MTRLPFYLLLCLLALALSCASPGAAPTATPPPAASPAASPAGVASVSRADIQRFEQEARALAKTNGCAQDAQCKAAPVGAKACGGPRYWLPYCPLTSDVNALMRKLAELQAAEHTFNQENGIMSDCAYVTEPPLTSVSGSCQAH